MEMKNENNQKKFYVFPKKATDQNYKIKINKLIKVLLRKKLIFNLYQQVRILHGF